MRPATALLALLPLAALLLGPAPRAEAGGKHAVPRGRPVQLDGSPLKAEWEPALSLPLGAAGSRLKLQQFRGTLLLALESDRVWTPGATLSLFFCPDGPKAGGRSPGCVRIDFEPFKHDRAHVIAYAYNAEGHAQRLRGRVVVRHALGPHGSGLEMAFGLDLLGLAKDARPALRFCAQWARPGAPSLFQPLGLDFRPRAGGPPADFVSAERWTLLEGWTDPAGPGAFPATTWAAWIERDQEIARRGASAHARVRELVEEWRKETKRDKEIVPEVIDNLEWVRRHEALTTHDVLAMATTWRYLNRHERADALLAGLIYTARGDSVAGLALRERALLHASREDPEAEALAWEQLAIHTGGALAQRYRDAAVAARAKLPALEKEQAARAADAADGTLPRVRLHTTHGVIEIVLHAKDVPNAVKHFLELVGTKFYDGTLFHRVKGDFLAQGGDPKSRTMGCEHAGHGTSPKEIDAETNTRHGFHRGAIAFAQGQRPVNGSQFFILTAPRPDLGSYTCFGHVTLGMDVADRLEHCDALIEAVVVRR